MSFGEKLREARKKKGLTQTEVGDIIGVGQTAIAKYENGIKQPSVATLALLAKLYEVSADYLIYDKQNN